MRLIDKLERFDFFKVQNTNNCFIKLFDHSDSSKIIIVSLIDNLLKGAALNTVQIAELLINIKKDN